MVYSQNHVTYNVVLAGELVWVPNTHMVYNFSSRISDSLVWPPWELGMHVTHLHNIQANTHAHKILKISL